MFQLLKKREQRIIQSIHSDFDNAEERLLQEAKDIIAEYSKGLLITDPEKVAILKNLGFNQHALIKQDKEVKEFNTTRGETVGKARMLEAIINNHRLWSKYKFLTWDELNSLCWKYNLIHASVAHYTGEIPDKNLMELRNIGCLDSHIATSRYKIRVRLHKIDVEEVRKFKNQVIDLETDYDCASDSINRKLSEWFANRGMQITEYKIRTDIKYTAEVEDTNGLYIVAPKRNFNLEGLAKHKYGYAKIQIIKQHDPIVFRHVKGGVEVLSKWGLEASDPILVNEVNN